MARKFEFKDNVLKLDIAGNIFDIDTSNPDLVKNILTFAKGAEEKAEQLQNVDDYVDQLEAAIELCLTSIDAILGEGASDKIFAGRNVSLFDCLDVINYIVVEIKNDREEKLKIYSPNRAQRRTKK